MNLELNHKVEFLNTSHVTIQPKAAWQNMLTGMAFKYIPCYYSTESHQKKEFIAEIFKYIPCYYST